MDPRFILSALAGMFCIVIFATVTTIRHVSNRADPAIGTIGLSPAKR
jgi:hypothetical protein